MDHDPATLVACVALMWGKVVIWRPLTSGGAGRTVLRVNPKTPSPMGVAPLVPQRLPSESSPDDDFDEPTKSRPAEKFYSEPPTRQKNVVASVYQSLLSVFDEMTPAQRMEFVDLASRFAALDDDARAGLMDLLPQYATLGAIDRSSVRALVLRLSSDKSR